MVTHQRQSSLAAVKDPIDVDREAALPVFECAGLDIACNADPGIVDQHIETAQVLTSCLDSGIPLRAVGNIMLDAKGSFRTQIRIDRIGSGFCAVAIDVGQQDTRALFCEPASMGCTQALRTTCYQCKLALTSTCHS